MAELNEKELQAINALGAELIAAQQLEIRLKADDGNNPIQRLVDKFAATASLYDDPNRLKKLISELELTQRQIIKSANITGRILGKKAVASYLDNSERRNVALRKLRLIKLSNAKQAERRLKVATLELRKEAGVFSADINIFKANAKIAGFSDKEILSQLVIAGRDKTGFAQGFAKRVKSINVAAERREKSSSEIDEYRKTALENELWVWVTVSVKPCPDCMERAGKVLPIDRWEKMGLPGSGRTICGRFCRCKLFPESIGEDKFPTVKEFNFNRDKLVLTTASEQRILEAKKNKFNFIKEKRDVKEDKNSA
jgi:hypothetical protein